MTIGCPRLEELQNLDPADLEQLDASSELGLHVQGCARCRAWWLSYRSFAEGDLDRVAMLVPLPEGADPEDAERRLSAVLHAEIFGTTAAEGVMAAEGSEPGAEENDRPSGQDSQPGTERSRSHRRRRSRWSLGPIPASVWSVAAVLAILGAVLLLQNPSRFFPSGGPSHDVLREGGSGNAGELRLVPPVSLAEDQWRLAWSPVDRATAYEVRLYSADLEELWRSRPITETTMTFEPASVLEEVKGAGRVANGQLLLWRVFALYNGDEIARSAVGSIRLP